MQNPTADAALEIALVLLETARSGQPLSADAIDALLAVMVKAHASDGHDGETEHLRERLIARMSLNASAEMRNRLAAIA